MDTKDLLIKEIEQTPDFLLDELLDFLRFLKQKHLGEIMESTILSESSLKKDWLRVEEDEAWQDL